MNEKQKTILSYILCFLLGVAITLAVAIPVSISSTRRANIKSGELSVRLSETERRLTAATVSIADCRKSTERIIESISASDGTLTGIIQSLREIRDEVQNMEERLYSYDNNCGINDSDLSVPVAPSE